MKPWTLIMSGLHLVLAIAFWACGETEWFYRCLNFALLLIIIFRLELLQEGRR